ncbi:MAG: type IV toxin-antitoxin system AbiEi family antitoxin domain-containing protein [Actinobacteria bacterium]|nr:type IV toxin-antitoxin system AbiEi family antitoxin domain-containing protein [Actinomycetota bacterium]
MEKNKSTESATERAKKFIEQRGGIIRTTEALGAGIHPRILYGLRDNRIIEQVSRGVYRLIDLEPISNPDLVIVASRVPRAVICLISALIYHDITTQIHHEVSIALEKGAESPRIDYPPVFVHRFSKESFKAGIEKHNIDGIAVRIYNPEKTLTDCFKFRNKIGMSVVLEALKLYKVRKKFNLGELLKYAHICRVEKIMKPYLEAML